jgi:hypothetical protein
MAGISRVHGGVVAPVTLHGGYQMTFLKVTGTGVATADTVGAGGAITEGNFQKAIRAIQTVATLVWIGTRADDGFVVAVDGATAQPTGPAYDTDSSPTVTERVKAVVDSATGVTSTVVVPGLLAANVS